MAELKVPASGKVLGQILQAGGELAEAVLGTGIHRTQLWKYSTGRSRPDADQITKLHRATKGVIAADGWSLELSAGAA